jgi:hypothetical protein
MLEQQDNINSFTESLTENCKNLRTQYQQLKETLEKCTLLSSKLVGDLHKINAQNMIKDITGKSKNFSDGGGFGGNSASIVKLLKFMSGMFGNARASGGNVIQGTPYLVGERGPEMFVPSMGGQVLANNSSTAGKSINIVMNINGADAIGFQRSRSQVVSELASAIKRAKNI